MKKKKSITQPRTNNKGYALLIVLILVAILSIASLTILQVSNQSTTTSSSNKKAHASYYIAESALVTYREQLKDELAYVYKVIHTRYEGLKVTDKAAFDVQKQYELEATKLLQIKIGQKIITDNYEENDGETPLSEVVLKKRSQDSYYTLTATGEVGKNETTLEQKFTIQLNVDSKSINGLYDPIYTIHAMNDVVVQNGAKVIGAIASASTNNIKIDPSACHYEQTTSGIHSNCLNDGNTDASPIKMNNAQSFENFLPSFPSNDLQALDELAYAADEYFEIEIEPEILEDENIEEETPSELIDELTDEEIARLEESNAEAFDETEESEAEEEDEIQTEKVYFIEDGNLTINDETAEAFIEDAPYTFENAEEHFNEVTIDGIQATIDVGDTPQMLRIEQLSLKNGASLNFVGSGDVKLFIKNFSHTNGTITTESTLETYYDGKKAVTFAEDFSIPGFLYSLKADISLNVTDTFDGNILSGGEKLALTGGNSTQARTILAPNAKIALTNNTTFTGSIIGSSILVDQSIASFQKAENQLAIPITYLQYSEPKSYIALSKPTKK